MSLILNSKQWLTLDDAAKKLSISFGEDVTRKDVIQLCAEQKLKISLFFPDYAAGYEKGREFCPFPLGSYYDELLTIIEFLYKEKHGIGFVNLIDFDPKNLERAELDGLVKKSFETMYGNYFVSSKTSLYYEEHTFKGAYEIVPEKNSRFMDWLWELVLNNNQSVYKGECHTAMFQIKKGDEFIEFVFNTDGWNYDDTDEPKVLKYNFGIRGHELNNPHIKELESLLVIQSKHLIDFESELLNQQTEIEDKPIRKQQKRELLLSELIVEEGEPKLAALGRMKVWELLTRKDQYLFPPRETPTDSTVKKFFDDQTLLAFSKGRKG